MMKKQLSTLLAAMACSAMLSSCYMFWNTGAKLKDQSVTYTGVDTARPVGDVVYKSGGKFYVQVPEVTYQTKHLLCGVTIPSGGRFSQEKDVEHITGFTPTGRTRWYEADGYIGNWDGKFHYRETNYKPDVRPVAGCPAGAKRIPFGDQRLKASNHISLNEIVQTDATRCKGAWLYSAGAAPLTYVVDPVLTGVSTPALYVAAVPLVSAVVVAHVVCAPFLIYQQQEPATPAKPDNKP